MNEHDMCEQAYKNGYEAGKRDAVKHGRWRIETDEEEPNPMFKLVECSACNRKASNPYAYCPNCGARMDGE